MPWHMMVPCIHVVPLAGLWFDRPVWYDATRLGGSKRPCMHVVTASLGCGGLGPIPAGGVGGLWDI